MEIDVHLGSQRTASRLTVRSAVAVLLDEKNVSAYSSRCSVPNGGSACDGCANAADVVTTFLVLAFLCNVGALWAHYRQLMAGGATRPTRVVIGGANVVIGISALTMIATFEEDCFKRIPSTLSPNHGACYVFAAFIFIIALGEVAAQLAVTEQSTDSVNVVQKEQRKEQRRERAQSRASQSRPVVAMSHTNEPAQPQPVQPSRRSLQSSKVAPMTTAVSVEGNMSRKNSVKTLGPARRVSVNEGRSEDEQPGSTHAKFARRGSSSIIEALESDITDELGGSKI
jgi:hypothetical protein